MTPSPQPAPEWRSIVEPAPRRVLRKLEAAGVPPSGERMDSLLYRLFSMAMALSAHILVAGLLMLVSIEVKIEEESPVFVRLVPGRGGGDETKQATLEPPGDPKETVVAKEPEPSPPPEPEPPKPEAPPAPATVKGTAEPAPSPGPAAAELPPAPNPGPALEGPAGPAAVGVGTSSGSGPGATDGDILKDPTEAIRRRRAGSLAGLRGGTDRAILVVSGCYDRVQDVLDKLGIPHRTITPEQLPRQDLSQCRAVLINCHNVYATEMMKDVARSELEKAIVELDAKLRLLRQRKEATNDRTAKYRLDVEILKASSQLDEAAQMLRTSADAGLAAKNLGEFVAAGGYVFTSDWGLSLVERALPGYVKYGGLVGPRTVSIRAKPGNEGHPILTEVFMEGLRGPSRIERRFDWEIDSASYAIRIEKPEQVEVLVEAPILPKYPAVAVTFRHEKGRVLHVLSHFIKQATKHGDYALQNMLLNFLIEKWEGKVPPSVAVPLPPSAPAPAPPPAPKVAPFAARGVTLALPEGWTAREGEGEAAILIEGGGATGEVRIGPAREDLASGRASWDSLLKTAVTATITRRTQAICRGCPAMIVSWKTGDTIPQAGLQLFVASPKALYTVRWAFATSDAPVLEPLLDKVSRSLAFPSN